MDIREYIMRCEEKCEAPIKLDHAKHVTSVEPYWRHISPQDKEVAQEDVPMLSKRQAKKKKKQNETKSMCHYIRKGLDCPHGDGCKYFHDVDAFLKTKDDDLPGICPFYASSGSCKYDVMCRFASSHGNARGKKIVEGKLESVEQLAASEQTTSEFWRGDGTIPCEQIPIKSAEKGEVLCTLNDLQKDTQIMLRKRVYDFSTANGILDSLGITNTAKNKSNRKENQKRKVQAQDDGEQPAKIGCLEEGATKDAREAPKKIFDARGKTYLAPLTTVGNLPFRRICKSFGADITCGEMAMATNLLQGQASEWALLKRHPEEDFFGVQVCGAHPDSLTHCAQLIEDQCDVNFVDLNCGCPIDIVVNKGAGSACLKKPKKLENIVRGISSVLTCPVTVKMRRGFNDGEDLAHKIIPLIREWGASATVIHGRSREQRYSKLANWEYIKVCAAGHQSGDFQVIGNGDVFSWQDHVRALEREDGSSTGVATTYVARGALIKPWIFTEIKEKRDWDISASERLDIMGKFVRNGLEHWGSDSKGVENTRRFLLEWLSFSHRYIPVGLLEALPQKSHWRPAAFVGRSDLETLLASQDPKDWVLLSEMFLGKAPANFSFKPKHKAKSHVTSSKVNDGQDSQENG